MASVAASASSSKQTSGTTAPRATVGAGCSSGSQAAVNAYGKQVCSSISALLVSKKKMGAFVVGRPSHAMAIYDTWATVTVRGTRLPAALLSWWQYTWPRKLMPV